MRRVDKITAAIFGATSIHDLVMREFRKEILQARVARGNLGYGMWGLNAALGRALYVGAALSYARRYRLNHGRYPSGTHVINNNMTVWFNPEIAALGDENDTEDPRNRHHP